MAVLSRKESRLHKNYPLAVLIQYKYTISQLLIYQRYTRHNKRLWTGNKEQQKLIFS